LKIYLDTCCLSRPFNDQTPTRIRRETEAIEIILKNFSTGDWHWIASGVLAFEVDNNRDVSQRIQMKSQMVGAHINVSIGEIEEQGVETLKS
jgi:anti-sigma factor ChrR (cupin superfamily)